MVVVMTRWCVSRYGSKIKGWTPVKRGVSRMSVMVSHQEDKVDLNTIREARDRVDHLITRTPVMTSSFLNSLSNRNLFFKCELMQKTGSFKFRGACNAVLRLLSEKDNLHVVSHSSGNHAQALAHAARVNGVRATIVVPKITPQVKKDAVLGYGANLVQCENSPQSRVETCNRLVEELDGGEYVPSGDHPFVMEGQGTSALELMEQVPNLDAVVVCASSGGLLSGVAIACKQINPNIKVYGAEPLLKDNIYQCKKADERLPLTYYPKSIADGLRMGCGEWTWPIIREYVDDVILVSEEEIINATLLSWQRMKLCVEPSGAVPLAAVLSDKFMGLSRDLQNVGVYLSGGNLDLTSLPWMKGSS